jgi:creatinine amidohydrolase
VIHLGGWAESTSARLGSIGGSTVGLIPVGAVEQHGPHLPLATDTIIATELCRLVAERTDAVVTLPPVVIGCSLGHGTRLPGTLSVTPFQLAEQVVGMVRWAAETSNLRKFLLVNAHVGNAAALGVATDQLRSDRPDLQTGYVNWGDVTPPLAAAVSADAADWHANRAETSLMMVLAPDLVDEAARSGADDPDRTDGLVFRYTAPSLSTNGVTGRPSDATVDLGEWLLEEAVSGLCTLVKRAGAEVAPLQ